MFSTAVYLILSLPSLLPSPSLCLSSFLQIHSTGGTLQANIVYSVNDSSVVTVDESGLIRAVAVGCALVTGRAEAKDSVTEKITSYTEASVHV